MGETVMIMTHQRALKFRAILAAIISESRYSSETKVVIKENSNEQGNWVVYVYSTSSFTEVVMQEIFILLHGIEYMVPKTYVISGEYDAGTIRGEKKLKAWILY